MSILNAFTWNIVIWYTEEVILWANIPEIEITDTINSLVINSLMIIVRSPFIFNSNFFQNRIMQNTNLLFNNVILLFSNILTSSFVDIYFFWMYALAVLLSALKLLWWLFICYGVKCQISVYQCVDKRYKIEYYISRSSTYVQNIMSTNIKSNDCCMNWLLSKKLLSVIFAYL